MTVFTTPAPIDDTPGNWRIVFNTTATALWQAEIYARGAIMSAASAAKVSDHKTACTYAIQSQIACDKSGTAAYDITRAELWLIMRADQEPAIAPLVSITRSRAAQAHTWHARAIDAAYSCRHHRHSKEPRPVTTPEIDHVFCAPVQHMLGTPLEPVGAAYGAGGARHAMHMSLIATDAGWTSWSTATPSLVVVSTAQWTFHVARAVQAAVLLCAKCDTRTWAETKDAVKNAHMSWLACAEAWHRKFAKADQNDTEKIEQSLQASNCAHDAALAWGEAVRAWNASPHTPGSDTAITAVNEAHHAA